MQSKKPILTTKQQNKQEKKELNSPFSISNNYIFTKYTDISTQYTQTTYHFYTKNTNIKPINTHNNKSNNKSICQNPLVHKNFLSLKKSS